MAIRHTLQHEVKQAQPITLDILKRMLPHVNVDDQKQLAIWVAILFGFFLFLRKSNLVPDTRSHDPYHQLSRRDIKVSQDVMIVNIKWSKTIQFGQKKLQIPVVANHESPLCLLKWLLIMVNRIPAKGQHNLFSFNIGEMVVPVTYRDLTVQMRRWLEEAGVPEPLGFSSHSLRCGGCTHAFENQISKTTIMVLGDWVSQSFRRYIDLTVETRLKAWFLLPKK